MDLTNKHAVQKLLRRHHLRPQKKLGQNFLVSRPVLNKFIDTADIKKKDTVVEIGAGIGTVTVELTKCAKRVIAVEKDKQLTKILTSIMEKRQTVTAGNRQQITPKTTLKPSKHRCPTLNVGQRELSVANEDIRTFNPRTWHLKPGTWHLVGNLPFYLTNFVIRKFLESDTPPKDTTFIVQKEVAERICARPPRMNLLAVSVQFYGEPKLVSHVPKSSFWPEPEVDAAILTIKQCPEKKSKIFNGASGYKALELKNASAFFKIVRAGFSHPRKYLSSNLSKKLQIPKNKIEILLLQNKINQRARAENLSVEDWIAVSRTISKVC